MDDGLKGALAPPASKHSPLVQFTHNSDIDHRQANNNENSFIIPIKSPVDDSNRQSENSLNRNDCQQSNRQTLGSSSPQLSSNSSTSSQAQSNDDYENQANTDNNSPSSPQSSYNSSYGSNSGLKLVNNSSTSITALVPGGVVTTQNISTVIKPKGNNNSLQFVKIQTPELSKKAVEQIKLAEETKISKEKIKEVEEEWQNNLLNWKSKRRQQFTHTVETVDPFEMSDNCGGRKIKTFAEMIEQRAKSGNRLGFHLQRYIATDDDEDERTPPEDGLANSNDETDRPGDHVDSDYEAQSSSSSGYNNADSKTPNSPEIFSNNSKLSDVLKPQTKNQTIRCDIDPANCERDSKDTNSISLVEGPASDQLNSTLLQGIRPPSASVLTKVAQPSSILSRVGQGNRRCVESDNSESDEEDEEERQQEEEEQKRLQRIAFEAKLKAFERLTKPSTVSPKSLPNRIVKPPLSQIRAQRVESSLQPQTHSKFRIPEQIGISTGKATLTGDRLRPSSNNSATNSSPDNKSDASSGEVVSSGDLEFNGQISEQLFPPKESLIQPPPRLRSVTSRDDISTSKLNGSIDQSANLAQRINSLEPRPSEPDQVDLISSISQLDLNQKLIAEVPERINHKQNDSSHINLNTGRTSPKVNNLNSSQMFYSNDLTSSHVNNMISSAAVSQNSPPHVVKNSNSSSQVEYNHPIANQKHRNMQPTQEPLKGTPTTHRKSASKDDRTVLSVSGKKRCSSCKEELGRGAAAFVVESLSLVYHTNCFRCSVCHVNLSNGFRGVDVRVHAGALHCQNCYSKDGLNYSRV